MNQVSDNRYIDFITAAVAFGLREPGKWIEGRYEFDYHSHSTARHLVISAMLGGELLRVYQRDAWVSSSYGDPKKPQGFILEGPWVEEIEGHFADIAREVADREKKEDAIHARRTQLEEQAEAEKIERFRQAFAD